MAAEPQFKSWRITDGIIKLWQKSRKNPTQQLLTLLQFPFQLKKRLLGKGRTAEKIVLGTLKINISKFKGILFQWSGYSRATIPCIFSCSVGTSHVHPATTNTPRSALPKAETVGFWACFPNSFFSTSQLHPHGAVLLAGCGFWLWLESAALV